MVGVANMMASRGMGAIRPSKMPGAKTKARRDDTDFTQFKEGGKVKSKVNAAGNYTKPSLRKRIFNSVKAAAIVGTGAGQWSARKAQVMAKRYKAAGGGYRD
jgi:putative N-acetylmannosamine-6-phosphate epimerase